MKVQKAAFLRCSWVLGGSLQIHNSPGVCYRRAPEMELSMVGVKWSLQQKLKKIPAQGEPRWSWWCLQTLPHIAFCIEVRNQEEFSFWPQFQILGNQEPSGRLGRLSWKPDYLEDSEYPRTPSGPSLPQAPKCHRGRQLIEQLLKRLNPPRSW